MALYLSGEVKPHILLDPGGYLSLYGVAGRTPAERLEIKNNHETPMKITGIDSDIPDRIQWSLQVVSPGHHYTLKVGDASKTAGSYTGHLTIRTDLPEKPEIVVVINGEINERSKDQKP